MRNSGSLRRYYQASGLVFDLRNSTKITRRLSSTNPKAFKSYLEFMQGLAHVVYELCYGRIGKESFSAINHTGDGFLCVFWDKSHARTAFQVALEIRRFLRKEVAELNRHLPSGEHFGFGIALHTGGTSIWSFRPPMLKLIFGILPNTVSKLEKQTKRFVREIVLTGNFRKYLRQQLREANGRRDADWRLNLEKLDGGRRVNIEDGKTKGHLLYSAL